MRGCELQKSWSEKPTNKGWDLINDYLDLALPNSLGSFHGAQPPSPCKTPEVVLISKVPEQHGGARVGTIKHTQEFLCFHIDQAVMMIKLFTPFLLHLGTHLMILCHHSAKDLACRLGTKFCNPKGDNGPKPDPQTHMPWVGAARLRLPDRTMGTSLDGAAHSWWADQQRKWLLLALYVHATVQKTNSVQTSPSSRLVHLLFLLSFFSFKGRPVHLVL